jgi:DNA repair protein RadC
MQLPESTQQRVWREAEGIVDKSVEHQVWLLLSMTGEVLGRGSLTDNLSDYVQLPVRQIIQEAKQVKASRLLYMHQHPNGDPRPSDRDLVTLQYATDAFPPAGIVIDDCVIVGRNQQGIMLWSARDAGYL